ncbi:triose-phosphate isomerase family protein [Schumannella luteola]
MSRTVGVSLKMYFGHAAALSWFDRVAELAREHPAVASGEVELFVIPSFPAIPAAIAAFEGTRVLVGAQDLFWEDSGAFTGEVSGAELAEIGVRVAEVGHAERRRLFFETDDVVAAKTTAALRNGIAPVLCIGEVAQVTPALAAAEVISQLDAALEDAPAGRVIVAYEPVWAIGAAEPAGPDHISPVCRALREHLDEIGREGTVIYGGSAGPGLLTRLGDSVDGLFLGRFAHDPAALAAVLDEAAAS